MEKMRNVTVVWLLILCFGFGCSLDGGSEGGIYCGITFDTSLLGNPPEDTVWIKINSGDSRFQRTFRGVRREEQFGNPIEGNYTNLFIYERTANPGRELLKGLGTTVVDLIDSANVTLAFNIPESTLSDRVCRMSKTLQSDHEFSEWIKNKQGAEIRMTLNIDGEWILFTTDGQQEDGFILDLDGAELLDEFNVNVRLKGTFSSRLVQESPASETPMEVGISGSFIMNVQAGYIQ